MLLVADDADASANGAPASWVSVVKIVFEGRVRTYEGDPVEVVSSRMTVRLLVGTFGIGGGAARRAATAVTTHPVVLVYRCRSRRLDLRSV